MDAVMQKNPVSIKKPYFVLDYVGDKEGFFIYWLKKRTFLDIKTFYMTAKFYDAKKGIFVKMMNITKIEYFNYYNSVIIVNCYYTKLNILLLDRYNVKIIIFHNFF
jgi:hypothetical protein